MSISDNPNLDMFHLPVLEHVGASCYITSNESLMELDFLYSLRTVGGTLMVSNNAQMMNIESLYGLEGVGGDLFITDNPKLGSHQPENVIDSLGEGLGGDYDVSGNCEDCP